MREEKRTDRSTFFPASIEDSHVLQIHTETASHGQGLTRVGLEATSDRAVRVCPETPASCFRMLLLEGAKSGTFSLIQSSTVALCTLWHRQAQGPLLQPPSTGTK